MKDVDVSNGIQLNKLDLWVQIHDLRAGFMNEKIFQPVGNYVGKYVESCKNNFIGVWREYLRVRVYIRSIKTVKTKNEGEKDRE